MKKMIFMTIITCVFVLHNDTLCMMLIRSINKCQRNKGFLSRRYCYKISNIRLKSIDNNHIAKNHQEIISLLKQIAENQKQILAGQKETYDLLELLDETHERHMNYHGCYGRTSPWKVR